MADLRRRRWRYDRDGSRTRLPLLNASYRRFIRQSVSWRQLLEALEIRISTRPPHLSRWLWRGTGVVQQTSTRKYWMLCLFHDERTSSLILWPDGRFFCHGCHAKGDMIDFVIWYRHLRTVRDAKRFFDQLH